jgi:hypothetical protein
MSVNNPDQGKIVRLENWFVAWPGTFIPAPPEAEGTKCLAGNIQGSSRFRDGESIRTSAITGRIGDLFKTKSGTLYELGKQDVTNATAMPKAKELLLQATPMVSENV